MSHWKTMLIGFGLWLRRSMLPSPGNMVFTLLIVGMLLWAQGAGALPFSRAPLAATSTTTIAYQGRLANASGTPITASVPMIFQLYNVPSGGTALWTETRTISNSVKVEQGLFNVMLGSIKPLPETYITNNTSLWLGVSINNDAEMSPRAQIGSVPYATQALTVPDASISTAKLANNSVTSSKIVDGSVTNSKLSNGSIDQTKAPSLVRSLNGDGLKIQTGIAAKNTPEALFESFPVTFNTPFIEPPIVVISNCTNGNEQRWGEIFWSVRETVTTTGFTAHYHLPTLAGGTYTACWIAIGR